MALIVFLFSYWEGNRCFLNTQNFIYLFLVMLGLCGHTQAFSRCGEQGLLYSYDAWASHPSGLSCCGAQVVDVQAPGVVAHGL